MTIYGQRPMTLPQFRQVNVIRSNDSPGQIVRVG